MSAREDILHGLRAAESGSVGDETPEGLLAEYDALKRAEVLTEVADLLMAADETPAALLVDRLRDGGESCG